MFKSADTAEAYMDRCLQLAALGACATAPNPMVGAVLVYEGSIIGEGWHRAYGGAHAEVEAVRNVRAEQRHLIPLSTLYVSLEPCNHFGKTPPCTQLIIDNSIKQVVVASVDPNPQVAGTGIQRLREKGIVVQSGIRESEAAFLNRKFFLAHRLKRPFITLKWAQCKNGYVSNADRSPVAISNELSRRYTHQLRATHMGIICGANTVLHDKPGLDNRYWPGRNPQVFVADFNGLLDSDPILAEKQHWFRLTSHAHASRTNDLPIDTKAIPSILECIYRQGVQSLLVEGGPNLHQKFLDSGLWDECIVYTGEVEIENGIPAPIIPKSPERTFCLGSDSVSTFSNI